MDINKSSYQQFMRKTIAQYYREKRAKLAQIPPVNSFLESNQTKRYDFSPWCIVTTGNQYMTVQALEHEDNLYPAGEHHIWNGKRQRELLARIRSVFENRIYPQKYGSILVMTTQNTNTQIPWPTKENTNG